MLYLNLKIRLKILRIPIWKFYHECTLVLSNDILHLLRWSHNCSLFSVEVENYVNWLEPLYSWDKYQLGMIYYHFYLSLDLICKILFGIFACTFMRETPFVEKTPHWILFGSLLKISSPYMWIIQIFLLVSTNIVLLWPIISYLKADVAMAFWMLIL